MTEIAAPAPTASSGAACHPPLTALDPAEVLADRDGCEALAGLVERLRAVGYDGRPVPPASPAGAPGRSNDTTISTLVALARRAPVAEQELISALGADPVDALVRCGVLDRHDGQLALTATIFPMRSVYTVLPGPAPGLDTVYMGPDSLTLFELVWAAHGYGDRAVDLATGNGFLAAAMATRYDHVIAADLSRRCVATAGLVPVVNPHLRTRFSAVQLDVADGLEAGAFDLVTGNPPWVPETVGPDGGPPRRFAAGGPTGFELPRRFLDAAADLLAPQGRAFIACLDIEFADGRRPLVDHIPRLEVRGLEVHVVETRLNQAFDYTSWARRKVPDVTSTRHVVVRMCRPA